MPRAPLTALILAGGEGRRCGGADKGWLARQGRPLVEHALDYARAECADVVIAANRNLERYAALGVPAWPDEDEPFRGPLAGIATALARVRGAWLFTLPVDQPGAPPGLAADLLAAATGAGAPIAVAHDGTHRQPLFAVYATSLAPAAAVAARSEDRAVFAFQDRQGAVTVRVAGAAAWSNLNDAATA